MNTTSARKLSKTNRIRALFRIIRELDYIIDKTPDRSMLRSLFHARRALVRICCQEVK